MARKHDENRRRTFGISMSELERGRYGARAKSLGLTLAAYLRQLAERDIQQAKASGVQA